MKKILIIGGIVVIALAVVFFIFLTINSSRPTSDSTLQTFTSEEFSLSYPKDTFSARKTVIPSGGGGVIIKPNNSDVKAQIEVQVKDSSQVPIERLNQIFTGYGLRKRSVDVGPDKIPATQFYGTAVGPTNMNKKRATFFEQSGKTYKIQLGYVSEDENSELNATYDEVISSFKIE